MTSGLGVRLFRRQTFTARARGGQTRRPARAANDLRARTNAAARSNAAGAGEPRRGTQRQKLQRFTASLRALPAENRGRRAALIFTGLPVRGLRPSRAA